MGPIFVQESPVAGVGYSSEFRLEVDKSGLGAGEDLL